MTDLETLLTRELEARGDAIPVGPVPLDAMVREAAVRRRRPLLVLGAAAAVAAVAVLAVVVPSSDPGTAPPVGPSASDTPSATPAGDDIAFRFLAVGRVQVRVPGDWGDPEVDRCGTPQADGIVQVRITGRDCQSARPAGVDTVEVLGPGQHYDPFPAIRYSAQGLEIDGVPARRSPAICADRVCTISLWVPSERVQVVIASSTSEQAAEDLVAGIRVMPEAAAVATKRIGIGHLSVEVPQAWSRDVARCGTATEDTLLTHQFARSCLEPPQSGVESVRIVTEDPVGSSGVDDVLDGVAIRRGGGDCEASVDGVCQSSIWVPSEGVGLLVSSVGDQPAVDAIIATAHVTPGRVALPAPYRLGDGFALTVEAYERRLSDLGLVLELPDGADLEAQPFVDTGSVEVGQVVPVGTSVPVALASGP